ncbi:MAG: hypothetical protein B7Y39_03285 [Bdellovibrio sp. 28-41-41]|nr:MAG: hypothetical protein B7Y39_03285 [Bdellovibrio sp. 28-41-41]
MKKLTTLLLLMIATNIYAAEGDPSTGTNEYCSVQRVSEGEDITWRLTATCNENLRAKFSSSVSLLHMSKAKMAANTAKIASQLAAEGFLPIEGFPTLYRKSSNSNESKKQLCIANGKALIKCSEGVSITHDILNKADATVLLPQNGFRLTGKYNSYRTIYQVYER